LTEEKNEMTGTPRSGIPGMQSLCRATANE